ncbi:murein transglycosylase [Pseudonocardiaceae bacterium YIM PH 21723]|nr:murein transglycosylase [Pseudonocardiaceae bacterium YIM PH 21723]
MVDVVVVKFLRIALIGFVGSVALGLVWLFTLAADPLRGHDRPPLDPVKEAEVEPGSSAPAGLQQALPLSGDPLTAWSKQVGEKSGMPPRAAIAYANAQRWAEAKRPACKVNWTTLAGIGRVESKHGQHGGAELMPDGRPSKPIIGVALDGSPGIAAIADTDGGALDGDDKQDRAVGPMQFIPTTWKLFAVRASGDGQPADPQSLDDAATTAANYLCSQKRDLTVGTDWWAALHAYNASTTYAKQVYGLAQRYATSGAPAQ